MQAVKGLSMEKWLCWGAMGASGFFLLLFLQTRNCDWIGQLMSPFQKGSRLLLRHSQPSGQRKLGDVI